ncbi:hypothetical protein HID58_060656, partial [Brassica napus]
TPNGDGLRCIVHKKSSLHLGSKQRMNSHQLLSSLLGLFAILQLVLGQGPEGFFSLDCGLSANEPSYTESRTGITFSSDEYFVEGGISGRIHKDEAETLKPYFPIKKRNCYNLNVMQENRYLIRAVFLYGNYDGQETHPKFDLFIDRTLWVTVSDQDEPDKNWESMYSSVKGVILEKEIIHTAKPNTLKVFLVKTDTTTPFISALELRPLSKNIYGTKNGSLVSIYRALLRDSYEEVRYPDDVHDRIWYSYSHPNWTTINNTLNLD